MTDRSAAAASSLGIALAFLVVTLATSCSTSRPSPEPTHAIRAGETIEGNVDVARSEAVLTCRGRPLLAYAFAPDQYKPYVRELHTLRGENVLLDSPPDHLHHHGLMYAIRVNGVNFWEERGTAGRQVSEGPPTLELSDGPGGLPRAVLRQRIRWQPGDAGGRDKALLVEQRTLTITVNPGSEEVALEWQASFEVGPGAEQVTLTGSDYNGLGLRLPPSFDRVATFANASGLPYSETQSNDVLAAAWTSAAGQIDGREVQVALGADRSNPGASSFFTMRNPFAYLAATQSLSREPLTYRRGESWRLRYVFVAYPAAQNAQFISERMGNALGRR